MADIAFSRADDLIFGNGELYVSIDGDDVDWRHLGNVDEFIITTTLEDVEKYSYNKLYLIANLPYYITTPILIKLIDYFQIIQRKLYY